MAIKLLQKYKMRQARSDDAREIAKLIAISSDGVAMIEWQGLAKKQQRDPLDVAELIYRLPDEDYSYSNATLIEANGDIAGMLLTFAIPPSVARDPKNRPSSDDNNVFAPYIYLEEPNSWYICGIAFYPQHRGQGLGTRLMELANTQAREKGYRKLSLIALEENTDAVRLYKRLGYEVVDSAPIVPHPLIPYLGDALLMTRQVM